MRTQRCWYAIQHVPFEGPGAIAAVAERRGVVLRVCRTYLGDALPMPSDLDGLVVMGGPMSVHDVDVNPNLADELTLLSACVDAEIPVLGVCFGCQLLALALGGHVYRGPQAEIGPGSVALTPDGRRDPVLGAAVCQPEMSANAEAAPSAADPRELPVVHWHQDTFELPPGATRLASSDLYKNQAFRIGDRAYGFQFHVEVDRGLAEEWASRLPGDINIDERTRTAVEQGGRRIISAFFDLAQARTRDG